MKSLSIFKSDHFEADVLHQVAWYAREADEAVAIRFFEATDSTLLKLARHPGLGRSRRFLDPRLQGLHSFRITPPFDRFLVFYRFDTQSLTVWRLLHGTRDLPRRLAQPSGVAGE